MLIGTVAEGELTGQSVNRGEKTVVVQARPYIPT